MSERKLRLFVSSPGDVPGERRRTDLVVDRLNAEFAGRVRIETVRWELSYYSAHETFQRQIPEAAECDVVVAVFRGRLGTPLPPSFPPLPSGEPYPSGTAYEVLSAMEVRRAGKRVPDVYVFRYPNAPSVALDSPDRAETEEQWARLKSFFDTWFRTSTGEFLAAFQTYTSTDDFAEKVEACLRQWLAQRGYVAEGQVWDRILLGSPFPGLSAFDADRARVFFGRDLALRQAVERLREVSSNPARAAFLLLLGASGSGKSSLLRAGLLPRLMLPGTIPEVDLWRVAVMTPGPNPMGSLAECLFADAAFGPELRDGMFRTPEMLARQMAGDPMTALAPIRDALERAALRRQQEAGFDAPRPARLLLAIDQSERLFTEADPAAAVQLATLLAAMARQDLATIVMALRSDAYAMFQEVEPLVGLREDGATLDLLPPTAAELEEIVSRPVAACQPPLRFEPSLAARLVADAHGGDALPLLQVSLARLYAAEAARGDGLLRATDYNGMDEAVTLTAKDVLATLDPAARAELPALVAGLVTDVTNDPRTGAPTPTVGALDRHAFEAGSPARAALVESFVTRRLLTAETDGARPRVRPVHEALLRIWPEAVAIVAEIASMIRVRHTLAPLVRDWAEAGHTAGHLNLSPALLDGALALLQRFGPDLPEDMRRFVAEAATLDATRRDAERQEQERRIRDAEALAAARRRTTQRTFVGLAAAVLLAVAAGWQWREAGAQRDRAQRSLTLATRTANGLVFDLAAKFHNTVGVPAAMVKDILDKARALQDQLIAAGESSPELRRSQANALLETSETLLTLGDTSESLKLAQQAQEVLKALLVEQPGVVSLDRLLAVSYDDIASANLSRGNLPAADKAYRDSLAIGQRLVDADPTDRGLQRDLTIAQRNIGRVQVRSGDSVAALASFRAGLAINSNLAFLDPDAPDVSRDQTVLYQDIGEVLVSMGNLSEALANFRAANVIIAKKAEAQPGNAEAQHDLMVSHERIGGVQHAQGDLAGALKSYQAVLVIARRLSDADPGNTRFRGDLAVSLVDIADIEREQGNLDPALANYQAAIALREALVRADPANSGWVAYLADTNRMLGDARRMKGDLPGAKQAFDTAIALAERLAAAEPGDITRQQELWLLDAQLGLLDIDRGDLAAAAASYERALAIATRLTTLQPGNTSWARDLSVLLNRLGDLLRIQGRLPDALVRYQASLAIAERLVATDPNQATWQQDLATSNLKVGDAAAALGDAAAALARYRAARAIQERIVKLDPRNTAWRHDLANCDLKIGDTLNHIGDFQAALASYQTARTAMEALVTLDPADARWRRSATVAQEKVGDAQLNLGDRAAALAAYQAALTTREAAAKADPSNALWQRDLSVSHAEIASLRNLAGDPAAALDEFRTAIAIMAHLVEVNPADAGAARELSTLENRAGDAEFARQDFPAARAHYRASLALITRVATLDPANAGWQGDVAFTESKLGWLAARQRAWAEARDDYTKARDIRARLVAANPASIEGANLAFNNGMLGDIGLNLHDAPAAVASYSEALRIYGRIAAAAPADAFKQRQLASAHEWLASAQVRLPDIPAAIANGQASVAIRSRLAIAHPEDTALQVELAATIEKVGIIQRPQDPAAAIASFQAALAIRERLATASPDDAGRGRALAAARNRLADLLLQRGDLAGALAAFDSAFATLDRLSRAAPDNAMLRFDASFTLGRLAALAGKEPDPHRALALVRHVRDLTAGLLGAHPGDPDLVERLAALDRRIAKLEAAG